MCCLRQLLTNTWPDHITNEAILTTTGWTPFQDILSKRRSSPFGHSARLNPDVPAHQALQMYRTFPLVGRPTSDGDGPLVDHERPGAPRSGLKSECLRVNAPSL